MTFSLEEYCTILLVLSSLIIIYLERKFPFKTGIPFLRKGIWTDLVWYTFIQSFFLKIVIFDYIILPIKNHYWNPEHFSVNNWPIIFQLLFFLITHDLYIYWFHRWQHANKILWRTHEAHHSNENVDWIAGARSHALEIIINQSIEFLPIFLLNASPEIVPIKACIDGIWGMFIHSNLKFSFGKLKYIFNGPEFHLWHHANHQEVFHANFSTKFSIWDKLFGTLYESKNVPKSWGLYYNFPEGYLKQHLFSIYRWELKEIKKPETDD